MKIGIVFTALVKASVFYLSSKNNAVREAEEE